MRATIRRLHSPDVENLAGYIPPDPSCFGFLLQIMVGPAGDRGEESFDVFICTPQWLAAHYQSTDIISGEHMLIVFEYQYERLWQFLDTRVARAEGATWEAVAQQLACLGRWEFADYEP